MSENLASFKDQSFSVQEESLKTIRNVTSEAQKYINILGDQVSRLEFRASRWHSYNHFMLLLLVVLISRRLRICDTSPGKTLRGLRATDRIAIFLIAVFLLSTQEISAIRIIQFVMEWVKWFAISKRYEGASMAGLGLGLFMIFLFSGKAKRHAQMIVCRLRTAPRVRPFPSSSKDELRQLRFINLTAKDFETS